MQKGNCVFKVHIFQEGQNNRPIFFDVTKAELLLLKLIHLFASELLSMKKLEIEKTKHTFIITILRVEYQVVLVSSISNFFTNKASLAN